MNDPNRQTVAAFLRNPIPLLMRPTEANPALPTAEYMVAGAPSPMPIASRIQYWRNAAERVPVWQLWNRPGGTTTQV